MNTIPPVLEQVFNQKSVQLADGQKIELSSNISREEAEILSQTVAAIKPNVSLEIGFAQGISTVSILNALEQLKLGEHHVIDPFQKNFKNAGLSLVGQAGLSHRLRFYEAFPEEVIKSIPAVDLAFIDSSHLFDYTLLDFLLVDKKLKVGGVVGFHDLWMPSLRKLLRFILRNRAYKLYPESLNKKRINVSRLLSSCLRCIPGAQRIFATNVLDSWNTYAIPNMVFIQKIKEDDRDWRHFADF